MPWMRREAMTSRFLSLHNQVEGKTFLTSKAVMAIASAIVPEIYEIDAQEQKFLMELVNARRASDAGGLQGIPQAGPAHESGAHCPRKGTQEASGRG